jgi:hypothetical protein
VPGGRMTLIDRYIWGVRKHGGSCDSGSVYPTIVGFER